VAPFYYYPGWWEAGPQLSAYVNLAKWNELPKGYQALLEAAAAKAHTAMLSKYDTQNPKALRELVAGGTKLMPFTTQVLEACYAKTNDVYAETMAKNPRFKKIYETWKPFRAEEVLWFRVVENTLDNFMARLSAGNKL
jgi:TRAP-type mannitol/chloroaromatic compound transport system substrate-binding protein